MVSPKHPVPASAAQQNRQISVKLNKKFDFLFNKQIILIMTKINSNQPIGARHVNHVNTDNQNRSGAPHGHFSSDSSLHSSQAPEKTPTAFSFASVFTEAGKKLLNINPVSRLAKWILEQRGDIEKATPTASGRAAAFLKAASRTLVPERFASWLKNNIPVSSLAVKMLQPASPPKAGPKSSIAEKIASSPLLNRITPLGGLVQWLTRKVS